MNFDYLSSPGQKFGHDPLTFHPISVPFDNSAEVILKKCGDSLTKILSTNYLYEKKNEV